MAQKHVEYKGYEIDVRRERCAAGYKLTYYAVARISDGLVLIDSFMDSEDSLDTVVKAMKKHVDDMVRTVTIGG